jgi:uncharacterized membrane protein YphA (DoxX/SURF4 family)
MGLLLQAHSGIRWLVVLAAVIAIVVFLLNWLQKNPASQTDRKFMAIFVGLFDLQWLLGVILLLWVGFGGDGFTRQRLEHAFTMTLALVLAHLSAKWKNAPAPTRARNYLFLTLGVLLLIIAGVAVFPTGWRIGN